MNEAMKCEALAPEDGIASWRWRWILRRIPAHIAIIMDGNGRWAKRRGLPRVAGHRVGRRPRCAPSWKTAPIWA